MQFKKNEVIIVIEPKEELKDSYTSQYIKFLKGERTAKVIGVYDAILHIQIRDEEGAIQAEKVRKATKKEIKADKDSELEEAI